MNLATLEKDLSSRDRLAPGSRYELLARIASGGMGTVYLGRLRGPAGFRRLVALKRAHDHLVRSPSFARMFRTEARLASRLHHPNVVAVHDVEELDDELVLVMDYVQGGALSSLLSAASTHPLDPAIGIRILLDAAAGLDAAHELTDDEGRKLGLVHRDVSPENVLVGIDGIARISDFGVAKVVHGGTSATDGRDLKGKIAYMAPECVRRGRVDARSDVFALGVVAWETLTERRLFRAQSEVATLQRVLAMTPQKPSELRPGLPPELDEVVLRALERAPDDRWPTARAFAQALEIAARASGLVPASCAQVGDHVRECVGHVLDARHRVLHEESSPANDIAHETSGIRITASIPRTPTPTPAALLSLPMSLPTGVVLLDETMVPPSRLRALWSRMSGAGVVSAAALALVLSLAAVMTLPSADRPPSRSHGRSLVTPRTARMTEVGGVLPESPLPDPTPLAVLPPPAPAPAPRPAVHLERSRLRVTRPPPPRDVAAPNPYGPSSSLVR